MFHVKRWLGMAAVAAVLVSGGGVEAQDTVYRAIPSTPDLTVTQSATKDFRLERTAKWVYIKNDCATALYFDLADVGLDRTGQRRHALRLGQNQVFEGSFVFRTFEVSPGAGTAAAGCTFTLYPGEN